MALDTNLRKVFARYYLGSRLANIPSDLLADITADLRASGVSGREANMALMDLARLVSHNSVSRVDWDTYPLSGCRFWQTRGSEEVSVPRVSSVFPTRDARIVAVLHAGHAAYYSSESVDYQPFILPPTDGDVRHAVQEHFRDAYGVEVSVRPIRRRGYHRDAPYIIVNTQWQTGSLPFSAFAREDMRTWESAFFDA